MDYVSNLEKTIILLSVFLGIISCMGRLFYVNKINIDE